MAGAAGQPESSLEQLYPPLAPALHAWACMRLSPAERVHVAPEDLTQEVWLRAARVFASFDVTRTTFRAWLFAVGKKVLLEVRRRLRRFRSEHAAQGSTTRIHALDQVPLSISTITQRLSRNEDVQRFLARVEELEPIERKTVLHCGLEGMPMAVAATQLGEAASTTAKRWQRLRARMATWAAPLGFLIDE